MTAATPTRIAKPKDIKVGDTVIALVEEYAGQGESEFDGNVILKHKDRVTLCYLSGYRSRTDDVTYDKILAVVDKSQPCVSLKGHHYEGKFRVYNSEVE